MPAFSPESLSQSPVPTYSAGQPHSYARMALLALAVGYAMDGFDLLILGFILSAVSAGLHLSARASRLPRESRSNDCRGRQKRGYPRY